MALIDTQTFNLSKQRLTTALSIIPNKPDVFSTSRMREARVAFISGKNVLSSIRGWLLAGGVIKNDGRQYFLTDYGQRLLTNDPKMERAGSWWSLHLNICFSERCEPYHAFFLLLGAAADYVAQDDVLISKLAGMIKDDNGDPIANASVKTNLEGVIRMFTGESPLTDLGLIDFLENKNKLKLGDPKVTDQTIIYALALARKSRFPTRITVNFRELIDSGFHHFICLSVTDFRRRLRELTRSPAWQSHFTFTEGKDLDSIHFGDKLNPPQTLLHLLLECEDTWI
ncbi:DUF4007 family protein [Thiocapsa marina]|uniref:DUF4007 domain-containing protein n=1 Tax=Thiocapsa marina 5811 TaxID=768671 RepID=F9UI35_9GAMM|nr:DUF4007 family protein [Thiocapsa marina]EGV16211.1 hypothetical protein ThimaDRAFT_4588 [Thiocapsa marina 5811]